jgi:predicted O-methyltransferase YrrM
LLTQAIGASRVLEIGTLGGYSTIWFARAVGPEGSVVTLEIDPTHAEVAGANLAKAGVADRMSIRTGRAGDSLAVLSAEGAGGFDLVFIDADKPSNPDYLRWALRLVRPSGLIG